VVKNWFSTRCWHVSMQLITSHRDAHSSRSFPTSFVIPELPLIPKTLLSRVTYSPRFLTSPWKFIEMITGIFACNYATSPLSRWRRVTPLHSMRTVMDNEKIPCMQSQHSSAHNHDRYNKHAREDHAVISLATHPPPCQQFSTYKPSSLTRREILFLWLNPNS